MTNSVPTRRASDVVPRREGRARLARNGHPNPPGSQLGLRRITPKNHRYRASRPQLDRWVKVPRRRWGPVAGRLLSAAVAVGDRHAAVLAEGLGGDARAERALAALVFGHVRSEEHTSELQSLMRISYAVFCLKKKTTQNEQNIEIRNQVPEQSKHMHT